MYIPVIFLNKQNKACLNKKNNQGGSFKNEEFTENGG